MISIFYGTRPEYIKLLPVYTELQGVPVELVQVSQHTSLIQDAHYDRQIKIGSHYNRLSSIVGSILTENPFLPETSLVVVQGDTATAYGVALAAYHAEIPIAHVEAGLRTYRDVPFPEEFYRRSISLMASLHFAPTELDYKNLKHEKVQGKIVVTGNTVADSLPELPITYGPEILITLHRRETDQEKLALFLDDYFFGTSYDPVIIEHPGHPLPPLRMRKSPPLPRQEVLEILARCHCVISDSGGLQEEAAFYKKKTIVCREATERPSVYTTFHLDFSTIDAPYPYGDGLASARIAYDLRTYKKERPVRFCKIL